MLLYYITDRRQFPGSAAQQRDRLLAKISEAAQAGINLVQLRERDLSARELYELAKEARTIIQEARDENHETRLLINSRLDVAIAAGLDGVHLRGDDIRPSDARAIHSMFTRASLTQPLLQSPNSSVDSQLTAGNFLFAVSCHAVEEVLSAEAHGADLIVYAPVFEKQGTDVRPIGLDGLRVACRRTVRHDKKVEANFASGMPILALGGVTLDNARLCIAAGASGIAGIRLFQENNIAEVVESLRD